MTIDAYVFCPLVKIGLEAIGRVVGLSVQFHVWCTYEKFQLLKELLNPKKFSCSKNHRSIFSFYTRFWNNTLFLWYSLQWIHSILWWISCQCDNQPNMHHNILRFEYFPCPCTTIHVLVLLDVFENASHNSNCIRNISSCIGR